MSLYLALGETGAIRDTFSLYFFYLFIVNP